MTATAHAVALARTAADAAADKLAGDLVAIDVSDRLVITDVFVIATAANDRQVRAVVDAVEERLQKDHGVTPARREGAAGAHWVLLDFVDVVVHVMLPEERDFYGLERLWKDCPRLPLPQVAAAVAGRPEDAS